MTASKPKAWRPPSEEAGVGMLDDGSLNVVTPAEYERRVLERNAEEALDNEPAAEVMK